MVTEPLWSFNLQEHQPNSWMPPSAPAPLWSSSSWTCLSHLWTWSCAAASPLLTGTQELKTSSVSCCYLHTYTSDLFVLLPPHRYHKLVWGPSGVDSQGHPSSVLITGGDNGNIILYDPAKIMAGESDYVIVAESDRHTGPVRALDVNPFQVRPSQKNWLIKVV